MVCRDSNNWYCLGARSKKSNIVHIILFYNNVNSEHLKASIWSNTKTFLLPNESWLHGYGRILMSSSLGDYKLRLCKYATVWIKDKEE